MIDNILACLITNMLPLEQRYKGVLFSISYGIWNITTFSTLSVLPPSGKKTFSLETGCKQQHLLGIVSAILLIVEILIVEFKF